MRERENMQGQKRFLTSGGFCMLEDVLHCPNGLLQQENASL